jgi:hypothetical protein
MAPTLVSQMVHTNLVTLRNALNHQEHPETPVAVRDFLAACELVAHGFTTIRGLLGRLLDHGVERSKLVFVLKEAKVGAEEALNQLFARVREIAAKANLPLPENNEALRALEAARQCVQQVHAELVSLLDWLGHPAPAPDDAIVAARAAHAKPGDFESLPDILARIQASGDV